jgi:limonene-1,2-epoxide hydrolase
VSSNLALVRDFCAAWSSLDLDRLMGFIGDDCFYHNIPMEPVIGLHAVREFTRGFLAMAQGAEFRILSIAESGEGVVLTERVDRFRINGNWAELPVMGAFEIVGGKIAKWRDYYDGAQANQLLAAAAQG